MNPNRSIVYHRAEERQVSHDRMERASSGHPVTSLNLFVCKNMAFPKKKLDMKLCAYKTIKDVFLFPSLKS
jgi:hypothetical protein